MILGYIIIAAGLICGSYARLPRIWRAKSEGRLGCHFSALDHAVRMAQERQFKLFFGDYYLANADPFLLDLWKRKARGER